MLAGLVLGADRAGGDARRTWSLSPTCCPGSGSSDPAAYLSLGLLVLIATPFVRVAGSIVAFARERDRRYVLVTAVVLAVMCLGVVLGKA